MKSREQITAWIAATTKEKLDRFAESLGLRKSFIVEQALLLFMQSREELPDEALIPARLLLEDDGFEDLVRRLEEPAPPSAALMKLMRGRLD